MEEVRRTLALASARRQRPQVFRFGAGLPLALAVDNPVAVLRALAQLRCARRIEIHQLTDVSHETLITPRQGTLSVPGEHLDVTVGDDFVVLDASKPGDLTDVVVETLLSLGAAAEAQGHSRFAQRGVALTLRGSRLATKLVGVCDAPDGTLWGITRDAYLHRFSNRGWEPVGPIAVENPRGLVAYGSNHLWIPHKDGLARVRIAGGRIDLWARLTPCLTNQQGFDVISLVSTEGALWAFGRAERARVDVVAQSHDGIRWERADAPVPTTPMRISLHAALSGRLWALGSAGFVVRGDDGRWERLERDGDESVYSVIDLGDVVYVMGLDVLLQWDGARLSAVRWREPSGFAGSEVSFMTGWGTSPQDLWFAGTHLYDQVVVVHWDGARFGGGDIGLGDDYMPQALWARPQPDGSTRLFVDDGRFIEVRRT